MPAITCRYVRTNGARCGSPALTGRTLCYHHDKVAHHHRGLDAHPSDDTPIVIHPISSSDRTQREPMLAEPIAPPLTLDIPPLEDRDSIQLALSMIITAMAHNRIDPRRATAMLYGLQVASANCRHIAPEPPQNLVREIVVEDGQSLALDEDPIAEPADSAVSRLVDLLHDHSLTHQDPPPTPPAEPLPPTGEPASPEQQAFALAQAQQSPAITGPAAAGEPALTLRIEAVAENPVVLQPDTACHGGPSHASRNMRIDRRSRTWGVSFRRQTRALKGSRSSFGSLRPPLDNPYSRPRPVSAQ